MDYKDTDLLVDAVWIWLSDTHTQTHTQTQTHIHTADIMVVNAPDRGVFMSEISLRIA